jgi:Ataxin-3
MSDIVRVYHEKQVAGLCGVHCLNTLMQCSVFTEIDLADIAARLDEQERETMSVAGTETREFLQFLAESSGNVADDGNYSIQVLEQALKMYNLTPVALTSPDAKDAADHPSEQSAFICHLVNHWFTVRQVGGHWFNLNSLDRPQRLSHFYLRLFLDTLKANGYSIFVVRGAIPPPPTDDSSRGAWHEIDLSKPPDNTPPMPNERQQIEEAMAASLSLMGGVVGSVPSANATSIDDDIARAISISLADNQVNQGQTTIVVGDDGNDDGEEDDGDLARAVAASLEQQHTATTSSTNQEKEEEKDEETEPSIGEDDEDLRIAMLLSLQQ